MNQIEDPLAVVADLRPAGLDQLAEEGYARRRGTDLARLTAEPAKPARRGRRRMLAGSGAGLAAAAALAAAVVALAVPSAHGPGRPTGTSPTSTSPTGTSPTGTSPTGTSPTGTSPTGTRPGAAQARLDAHAVLLASARVTAHTPAATGAYWYVKERDFEFAWPRNKAGWPLRYSATAAATQETWFGSTRTRTIVNEDLVFNFASPADKARWRAAGSPELANPSGNFGYTGPVTSDYTFGGYTYNIGAIKVSLAKARALPTSAAGLGSLLRRQWDNMSAEQRQATIGPPNPSFASYVFQVADALLTGPVTPGTRAAVYEMLAGQSGLTVAQNVTDPLGRAGTAIGDGAGDYLVIDQATARVLAYTTYPVQPGVTIPATTDGTEAYEAMGWTSQLGTPSGS